MGNNIKKEELSKFIATVLVEANRPLKAREIASLTIRKYGLEVSRKDVNSCLYGRLLKERVWKDTNHKWSLVSDDKTNGLLFDEIELESRDISKSTKEKRPEISVECVEKKLKFCFRETSGLGPMLFCIKSLPDVIEVLINSEHPAYNGVSEIFRSEDSIEENPALNTLKLLLIAWAKLEDEAEGQRQRSLEDARIDWGRIAWDLSQKQDD